MENLQEVVIVIQKFLNHLGVTLVNVDVDENEDPCFFVEIDGDRVDNVENTLLEVYGVLWTLVNGKVTEENKNNKIQLKYSMKEV